MIPHYDDQGTRTSLIYLTTDFEGGSTSFPLAGTEHKPQDYRPGHYIHYSSRHIHSFHGGMPVTKGTKVVIVLRSSFEDNINSVILLWEVFCFCYVKFRNLFSKKDLSALVIPKQMHVDWKNMELLMYAINRNREKFGILSFK